MSHAFQAKQTLQARFFRPFKSDLTDCQSEVHDSENRDTTKTDRTLQERSCRDFASTAAAAPQVPSTIMSSSETDALRTSMQDPKLRDIYKLYIHGGKDGGRRRWNPRRKRQPQRSKRCSPQQACLHSLVKMRGTRRVLRYPFVGHTRTSRAFLSKSSSLPTFQSETATSSVRSTTRPGMMHSWLKEKLHSHEHYVPRCHRGNLNEVQDPTGKDALHTHRHWILGIKR